MFLAHGLLGTPSPWFGVVGAIVALATLLRTALRERRNARRTDPELVAAWTSQTTVTDCDHATAFLRENEFLLHHSHSATVRNGGKQPIFEVVIGVETDGTDLLEGEEAYVCVSVGLLPPGETREIEIGCTGRQDQHQMPLEVWFTDVRGLRWKRTKSGRLRVRHGYRALKFSWAIRRAWRRLRLRLPVGGSDGLNSDPQALEAPPSSTE
jgi:hypothetical protein